jgi:single-stranded DNA-binding protein
MDIIGGNVGKYEKKVTKNGKEFYAFSVAETKGWGENKNTVWYDCTTWEDLGLQKGDKVVVFGHKGTREHNEKVYNTLEVFQVSGTRGAPKRTDEDVAF